MNQKLYRVEKWKQMTQSVMAYCTFLLPIAFFLSHAIADILCSLVAIAFLMFSLLTGKGEWLQQRWVKIGMLTWLYMIVRSCFGQEIAASLGMAIPFGRFIIFAAALQTVVLKEEKNRETLFRVLTACVVVALGETLSQLVFGHGPISLLLGREPFEGGRMQGPLNANRIGMMLVYLTFIVLTPYITRSMIQHRPDEKHHWHLKNTLIAGGFSLLFLMTVFVSGERMALILTSLGYILLSLSIWRTVGKWMAVVGLLKTLAMIGVFACASRAMVERQFFSTWDTLSHFWHTSYGQLWLAGLKMGASHPLTGIGLKAFAVECPKYWTFHELSVERWCNIHPHNIYIEWWSDLGIIGVVLFSALVLAILVPPLKRFQTLAKDAVWLGLAITLLLRFFPFTANTSFFKNWGAVPLWFVVGWFLALSSDELVKKVAAKKRKT